MKSGLVALALLAAPLAGRAADQVTVTAAHALSIARPAETIAVPWRDLAAALPGVLLQHLQVTDAAGRVLPYQVTNTRPLDPKGSYGELLFQHDFAAGEKSATFTVGKIAAVAPPFPSKVFARYVPERLDDFAWENDKIAHRIYGPALEAPRPPGSDKEVLMTSGLDVWCKRVDYLVVDRWYNKGHNHYHKDEGEGMDMYNVGPSRGCGGTGAWVDGQLYSGHNYKTWSVLANGPIRAIFELTYAAWDAHGLQVAEVKRFTVDAGHNLDDIESTFTLDGASAATIGIGLNRNSADRGQEPKIEFTPNAKEAWIAQWEAQQTNGAIGEAIVVPDAPASIGEDHANRLMLVKVASGHPVRYLVGAGWSKAGEFTTRQAWTDYVAACAARARSPVKVSLAAP